MSDDLVERIGFAPNSGRGTHETEILNSAAKQSLVRQWLQRQGIPFKAAKSALPSSLASAYCNQRYLNSWRTRLNPQWALLSEDTFDSEVEAVAPQKPEPTSTSTATPEQSEAWLKDLYAQITRTVDTLTDTKIRNAKLSLDESAKEAIRTLARETAKQVVAELSPPRKIEVCDTALGTVVPLGLQHEKLPQLIRAVTARDHRGFRLNIWMTGPTGSGKTSAAEAVAKALYSGRKPEAALLAKYELTASALDSISLAGGASETLDAAHFGSDGSLDADYKIIGFKDGNGQFHWTTFLKCFAFGFPYCADEIDNWLPSALLAMNAALANGFISTPVGMIQRHKDFVCIACANTWGLGATSDYVGRTKLDAASLDRFQPKIEWPIDEKLERALADNLAGGTGLAWHDIVANTRKKVISQGLKIIISPRATISGIALLNAGFPVEEVIDMTLAAGLSKEQKQAVGLHVVDLYGKNARSVA